MIADSVARFWNSDSCGVTYYHSYPENGVIQLLGKDVRPRARTVYQWHQLEPGMVVMVNYNPDDPKERGYWYDAEIQKRRETRTVREIYAKILLGYGFYFMPKENGNLFFFYFNDAMLTDLL